jgi:hypothetical protein
MERGGDGGELLGRSDTHTRYVLLYVRRFRFRFRLRPVASFRAASSIAPSSAGRIPRQIRVGLSIVQPGMTWATLSVDTFSLILSMDRYITD